ncbi:hypothetical protein K8W59_03830 [Nocardioides rotundus]|uniref:hypothetical protein n=1 Tax=Nocardioides rotundus TaxID=1774216 RepID=UPI001CC1BF2A|nr:hypothetical protein [Nocardioides rotundus]UAL30656.1 hypothetical protein K8W59_03830 [Nocardioides rotundus]
MGDHFTLDVDPGPLLAGARRLGEVAEVCGDQAEKVRTAPERWRAGWSSASSTSLGEQAVALGGELGVFRRRLGGAASALRGYAHDLDTAVSVDLADLNRRWREAQATYDDAVAAADRRRQSSVDDLDPTLPSGIRRDEERSYDEARDAAIGAASADLTAAREKLTTEYDDLKERLRRRTVRFGDELGSAVALQVSATDVLLYRLLGMGAFGPTSPLARRARSENGGPLGELAEQLAAPPDDYEKVKALLDRARELGLPPDQYATTLQSYWRFRAAEAAGIDLSQWDPSKGAEANRAIIEAVYRYYGDLYLQNPDLQWAGMANMIGPSFAAGFFDLDLFRRMAGSLGDLPEPLRSQLPPGMQDIANWTEEDLRFFESSFLDMQRQIFFDQGSLHQAYVDGGMEAIRELEAAGLYPPEIADAWADLDSGDPERVQSANEEFLMREQLVVIDDDYQRMFDHAPTGEAMTWLMTLIGAPSIPGARSYPEVFPLTVTAETPGPERLGTPDKIGPIDLPDIDVDNPLQGTVTVQTPFPDGNIADFDDRWALIEQDTLPAFQQLLRDDPQRARDLIGQNVGDRIGDYRLEQRIDEILAQLANWRVDVDQ